MPGDRKAVTVQYRKLDDPNGGFQGRTLLATLTKAMSAVVDEKNLGQSAEVRVDGSDPAFGAVVLNYHHYGEDFFFGEIVRFEPGADLPLLQIKDHIQSYNLTQSKAPDGHEPIRGMLYFVVFNDHLVFFENSLPSARLERYLTWLLADKVKVCKPNTHVILSAEVRMEGADPTLREIQQIEIKAPPITEASDERIVEVSEARERKVSRLDAMEVLRAAHMSEEDIQSLLSDSTSLEVFLQIRFKSKRLRRPIAAASANRLLRNLAEDDVTMFGPAGKQKAGKLVKLSQPAQVVRVGSLLDTKDALRALTESYRYFVSNGYIDA